MQFINSTSMPPQESSWPEFSNISVGPAKTSAVKEPYVQIFWNYPLWLTLTTVKSGIVDLVSGPGWCWEKLNLNT